MSITQRKQIGADSSKKNELDLGWSYVRRQRSFQDINLIAFNVLHILRELVWQRIWVIEKSQVIVTKQDPPPFFFKVIRISHFGVKAVNEKFLYFDSNEETQKISCWAEAGQISFH